MKISILDDSLGMVELTLDHPPMLYHATSEANASVIRSEGLYAQQGDIPIHLAEFDSTGFISGFFPGERIVLIEVDVRDLWLGPGWDGLETWTSHVSIETSRLKFTTITTYDDDPRMPGVIACEVYP